MNSKILAVLIATVVVIGGISAYVMLNNDDNSNGDEIDKIIIGTTMSFPSLTDTYIYEVKRMITQETLVNTDAQGNFIGLLAETWEEVGTTWTFYLKEDVVWSDGEPFDADDVMYTFEIGAERRASVHSVIKDFTKVDKYTVEVELANPMYNFMYSLMNMPIMPEHKWKDINWSDSTAYTNYTGLDGRIGTGPYVLKGLDTDAKELKFEANENFRDGAPNAKELIFKTYDNETTMLLALTFGDVDTVYRYGSAGVSNQFIKGIQNVASLKLSIVPGFVGIPSTIFFNYRHEFSSNEDFRLAIKYAIDYDDLIRTFAPDTGVNAREGVIPEGMEGWTDTDRLQRNLDLAKDHMDRFFKSRDTTFANAGPVDIKVAIPATDLVSQRIVDVLKIHLSSIKVNIATIDTDSTQISGAASGAAFTLFFTTPAAARGFDGFLTHYAMGALGLVFNRDAGTAPLRDQSTYSAAEWKVYTDYKDIRAKLRSTSATERGEAEIAMQQFYGDHALIIPMYWDSFVQPYNAKYEGFTVHADWGILCYETFFGLKYA